MSAASCWQLSQESTDYDSKLCSSSVARFTPMLEPEVQQWKLQLADTSNQRSLQMAVTTQLTFLPPTLRHLSLLPSNILEEQSILWFGFPGKAVVWPSVLLTSGSPVSYSCSWIQIPWPLCMHHGWYGKAQSILVGYFALSQNIVLWITKQKQLWDPKTNI